MKSFVLNTLFFMMLLNGIVSVPLLAQDDGTAPSQEAAANGIGDNPVKIVYPVVMPPYTFEDETGKAQGLAVDLLSLWSRKTGIPIQFTSAPWEQGLAMMRDGAADLHASLYYTEERDTYLDYATVVSSSAGNIFYHKNILGLGDPEDLKAYRVGAVRGSFHEQYIQEHLPEVSLVSYPEFPEMLDAAQKGDIRVFVEDVGATLYRLKERGRLDEFRYNPGSALFRNNFWIAAREGNSKLVKSLKEGMALITPEERIALERKWLGQATLKTQDTLAIAIYSDFAPFTFMNAEGKPAGLFVDIWKLWAEKTGRNIEFLVDNWVDSLNSLKTGNADIHSGLFYSDARAQWLNYSQSFYETGSCFFYPSKQEDPYKQGIFAGKKVGVIKGSYHEEHLRAEHPEVDVIPFVSMEQMLRAVLSEKISACLTEYSSAMALINRLGLSGSFNSEEPMHFITKVYAGILKENTQLLALVNEGFESITSNELADIEKRWVPDPEKRYYKLPTLKVSLTEEERTWLKAHPDIVLGYTDAFEPEVIVSPDGAHRGILVDFLDELNKRLGTRIRLQIEPVSILLEKAQKREIDGILSLHPDYADKLGLLKTRSCITNYPALFSRKDDSFDRPADLAGKKVAIVDKVFFSEQIVEQYGAGATVLKVLNAEEGLRLVDNGRADYFIAASFNAYLITKYQLFGLVTQYVFYEHPIDAVIGTRSDWPEFVSILNKGLSHFSKEDIEAIFAKWIHLPVQKELVELTPEEQVWLAENHTVRVRVSNFPPHVFLDGDEPSGIAIDYIKLIAERTGIRFVFINEKRGFWEAMESMAQSQGPDLIFGMVRNPKQQDEILFSRDYMSAPHVIYTRAEGRFITGINDLQGRTLAVAGSTKPFADKLEGITIQRFLLTEEALKAVSQGQADACICDLLVSTRAIKEYGLSNLKVAAPGPLGDRHLCFGNRPDWPELTSMINKALATITPAEKSAIQGKYLSLRYEYGNKPRDIVKWILIVVGISVLIVSMFVVWNRQLTRKVKQRTAEVVESHEKFRKFVEQSPISIQISNPDGSLNEVNPSFIKLWGFSEADMPELFEKYNVLQDEQARKLGIMPLLERAYKGEEVILPPIKYDANETLDVLNFSSHNAMTRWIQVRIYPIKDQNGELANIVHIEEDVTERKQTEESMIELRSELLHSTRAGTMIELTAALAHELNHPLGSILNNANAAKRFLENEDPDLDEIREIIIDIISEDRRASDVMQKLRALMKKTEVSFSSVQINTIIEEVVKFTHSDLIIKNVSLSKGLDETLPKVNGDRIQLQQVLLNLIINASDAMKECTIKRIHISTATHDKDTIIICVTDSGCGIDESKKDSLFKPFVTTKKEGMGMGLSVSKTILKSHEGDIWAENNQEGGASFFITLPIDTKELS